MEKISEDGDPHPGRGKGLRVRRERMSYAVNDKKLTFVPQKKNANKHTSYGLRLLEESVQRDGFIDAQTAAADGEIISGSARMELSAEKFADVEQIGRASCRERV